MASNAGLFNLGNKSANQGQPGIVEQIVFALVLVIIVYLTLIFIEVIYKYLNRLHINRTVLIENTCITDDKAINISQNPNIVGSIPVHLSDNERSGVEFSYAFHLNVHASAFRQELGLLHIFHKGYSAQFPLMAPGVYMRSDTNTLRVYMNTYKTWNNFVEVDNFPVSKWVHVVIVCKNSAMEIYINGNLSKKASFEGFAPYQNFQDICCFSQRRISLKHALIPSVSETGFDVFGCLKGMMSRLSYFNYALCFSEIQTLMNEGPSSKMEGSMMNDRPPYLTDTWWADSR